MSHAFDLVRSFRAISQADSSKCVQPPQSSGDSASGNRKEHRRKLAFAAFSAALFLVAGGFFVAGTNIPGVIAQEEQSAAAFFRADRARMRASRAIARIPTLTISGRQTGAANQPESARNRAGLRAGLKDGQLNRGKARRSARNGIELAALGTTPSTVGISGAQSVCVRMCDGFHFPVGDYSGARDNRTHEAICSGLCPGAPTRLYVLQAGAQDISEAVSVRRGQTYAALPVALRHTSKRDNTCSCRAPEQSHLSLVSLRKDFTLRRGDAVMTTRGMRVFSGGKRWPYHTRDFTSVRRAKGLTRSQRRTLYALERASTSQAIARQAHLRSASRAELQTRTNLLPALGPLPPARPLAQAAVQTR